MECYIAFSLEDYDKLCVYISGAFLHFGVKDGILEPGNELQSIAEVRAITQTRRNEKKYKVLHLCCAGVGFQMEIVVLPLESARFFW